MFKLKLKKYFYVLLKYLIKAKMEVYQVIIDDINEKIDKLETHKINNKNSKKEGK